MKVPAYRGKHDEMEADKLNAILWFKAQLAEHVDISEVRVSCRVDREGGHSFFNRDLPNYKYVWLMRDYSKSYSDARFVLRKDGSIRIEDAIRVARGQIAKAERERERDSIGAANAEMWKRLHNVSPAAYGPSRVAISRATHGAILVRRSSPELVIQSEIQMENLPEWEAAFDEALAKITALKESTNG
jgi:hypothetical protein